MDDHELETIENTEIEQIDENTDADKDTGRSNYPTQLALGIRAIVGAYVLYLAYQIITSDNEVTVPMWIAVAVFIVAGVALVIMSVKHYISGEYEGGKKDV